jgi:hypothetical protein
MNAGEHLIMRSFLIFTLLSVYLSVALQSFLGLSPLFQFLDLYKVSKTPWTGYEPVARPLPTHRTTQT